MLAFIFGFDFLDLCVDLFDIAFGLHHGGGGDIDLGLCRIDLFLQRGVIVFGLVVFRFGLREGGLEGARVD